MSLPTSFDSFKTEVGQHGFEHVSEVYTSIQTREPDFKLDTDTLRAWTFSLLVDGHVAEAINVAKLNVRLFPSGSAHSALGEAYAQSGQNDAAINSYKKALEAAPDDVFFKYRLDRLEATESRGQ